MPNVQSPTARKIATSVAEVWHRSSNNSSTLEIPLGIVATFALHAQHRDSADHSPCALVQLDREDLIAALRATWALTWLSDPYLVEIASPLHRWLDDEISDETIRTIRVILDAAHTAGLPSLVDPRGSVPAFEVLGFLVTELRPARARQHLGEFYTPPEVADVMAALTLPELPTPGALFADPTAGTGGLLAATANRIRILGGNPRDYVWEMSDINHLSVACAAANAVIWGLGVNVLVYRADTLAPGDHRAEALATRAGVLEHHRTTLGAARLAVLLTGSAAGGSPECAAV